jgi:transposase-like protein
VKNLGKYILDTREQSAYDFFIMRTPKTLQEAIVYFSDPDRCFEYAKRLRFPDGKVTCPRCGSDSNYFIKSRYLWLCRGCDKQFTLKVGTIFEDSPLSLDKWMTAFWMLCNCKNGVSSMEIHRTLGITQKSAWFMLQRLRLGLQSSKTEKMGGEGSEVEVDETYIGPRAKYIHKDRKLRMIQERQLRRVNEHIASRYYAKTPVQGFMDRESRQVRATVVADVKRETLQDRILNEVARGSHIYTDQAIAYTSLQDKYVHEMVNHAETYVRGRVHTNGMENFWSLLKRTLKGTYVAVEPFHLDRYLDEQVFRFNNRATRDNPLNDSDRFALAMSQVAGRRLTYSALTGKDESPRHETTGTGAEITEPF